MANVCYKQTNNTDMCFTNPGMMSNLLTSFFQTRKCFIWQKQIGRQMALVYGVNWYSFCQYLSYYKDFGV